MSGATPQAERLVTDYVEMWNEQDYARIPELVSDSFVMYDPAAPEEGVPGPAGEVHGPDGLETFMRGVFAGFPDFQWTILDMLSAENTVMYEARVTMTHEGEIYGTPPTGREVDIKEMAKYRIRDGRIQEHRIYIDEQQIAQQLGLTDG